MSWNYESFIRTIEYKSGFSNIECRRDYTTFEKAIKGLNEDLDIFRENRYVQEALIWFTKNDGKKIVIASLRTIR